LGPGERAVAVRNVDAFENRYGTGILIAGEYPNNLANGGETIVLSGPLEQEILRVTYGDSDGWPVEADGAGRSLVLIDLDGDFSDPAAWRASLQPLGSPGAEDVLLGDLNQDLSVSLIDLAMLQANLNSAGTLDDGDLNQDGQVDRADAAILLRNLGVSLAPAAPAAVPPAPSAAAASGGQSSTDAVDVALTEHDGKGDLFAAPRRQRRVDLRRTADGSAGSADRRLGDTIATTQFRRDDSLQLRARRHARAAGMPSDLEHFKS
jgi:hypothetical protein